MTKYQKELKEKEMRIILLRRSLLDVQRILVDLKLLLEDQIDYCNEVLKE